MLLDTEIYRILDNLKEYSKDIKDMDRRNVPLEINNLLNFLQLKAGSELITEIGLHNNLNTDTINGILKLRNYIVHHKYCKGGKETPDYDEFNVIDIIFKRNIYAMIEDIENCMKPFNNIRIVKRRKK